MLGLVGYDVNTEDAAGRHRLRRISKLCMNWGQRVQFSVFECLLDNTQWLKLRAALMKEMDETKDSLRFYMLGNQWRGHVEHIGAKPSYAPEGALIF